MFASPNAGDLLRPGCPLLYSLDHLASCRWAALPPMHPAVHGSHKMLLALSFGFFHSQRLVWFWFSGHIHAWQWNQVKEQFSLQSLLATIFDVQNTSYVVFINTFWAVFSCFLFFLSSRKMEKCTSSWWVDFFLFFLLLQSFLPFLFSPFSLFFFFRQINVNHKEHLGIILLQALPATSDLKN